MSGEALSRSTAGAERRFEAQALGRAADPGVVAVGLAADYAAADRFQFGVRLRPVHKRRPIAGLRQRPSAQPAAIIGRAVLPPPQAAPPPVLGAIDQARPQRVTLDVSHDLVKMLV